MTATQFPSPWLAGFGAVAVFFAHAAAEVDGAALLLGIAAVVLAVLAGALWLMVWNGRAATLLSRRPGDLLCVAGFTLFAVIAVFVDMIQAGGGPGPLDAQQSWAPALLKEAFVQWARECDPLLAANPLWYWFLAVLSPLLYLPFYVAAAVAFARQVSVAPLPSLLLLLLLTRARTARRGCATLHSCGARCCPSPRR